MPHPQDKGPEEGLTLPVPQEFTIEQLITRVERSTTGVTPQGRSWDEIYEEIRTDIEAYQQRAGESTSAE